MEPNKRKRLSGPQSPSEETFATNGSHDVTLDSNPRSLSIPKEVIDSNLSGYHLTATIVNSQLSQRDLSLLLDVLNYQVSNFGCNFSMYLALSELYLRLTLGRDPQEISDGRIRLTVTVSHIILKSFQGQDFGLFFKETLLLNTEIRNTIAPYLMSKRTYGSRYRTWRPERLIRIRAVPVDTIFERSSRTSKRYSSYTKGYGESHGNAHRQRTKPSSELDGEERRPDKSERNLILRVTDVIHQLSNQLWIKFKALSEGN